MVPIFSDWVQPSVLKFQMSLPPEVCVSQILYFIIVYLFFQGKKTFLIFCAHLLRTWITAITPPPSLLIFLCRWGRCVWNIKCTVILWCPVKFKPQVSLKYKIWICELRFKKRETYRIICMQCNKRFAKKKKTESRRLSIYYYYYYYT